MNRLFIADIAWFLEDQLYYKDVLVDGTWHQSDNLDPQCVEDLLEFIEEKKKKYSNSDSKPSSPSTLTLPLVKGVEEFWGYFEDSQGHIWYTKATKTSRGDKNE